MSNTLDKTKAISFKTEIRKVGGPRNTYSFKCSVDGCENKISVRCDALRTHSGKCGCHSHRKRPYESLYMSLYNDHRDIVVSLTYEEFLEFCKDNACHYCGTELSRYEYGTVMGEYFGRSYCLDRKDNAGSYSKENCVNCCLECNKIKLDRFTYDEFLLVAKVLREIYKDRLDKLQPSEVK